MPTDWFTFSPPTLVAVAVSSLAMLVWTIVVVRIVGLRAFSKMTGVDFVVTVAGGSILASTVTTSTSLFVGAAAFVSILTVQAAVALGRRRTNLSKLIDNRPRLLMRAGGELVEENMRKSRVTESDITAKLREANVTSYDQVLAVVLETTGDISVLHGEGPLEASLLDGVMDKQDG